MSTRFYANQADYIVQLNLMDDELTTLGGSGTGSPSFASLRVLGATYLGGASGAESLIVNSVASAVNRMDVSGATTGNGIQLHSTGTDASVPFLYYARGSGGYHAFHTNGSNQQVRISNTNSAVNRLDLTGAPTGGSPWLSVQGSDTNPSLIIGSKGAGAIYLATNGTTSQLVVGHVASAVNYLYALGSATGNAVHIRAVGNDTNVGMEFASRGTGSLRYFTNITTEQFRVSHIASAVNYSEITGNVTTGTPGLSAKGSDSTVNLGLAAKNAHVRLFTDAIGSLEGIRLTHVASIVNYWEFQGSISGSSLAKYASGASTDIGMYSVTKGAGSHHLSTGGSTGTIQVRVPHTASAINYWDITGAPAGNSVTASAAGGSTDVGLYLVSKGSGSVNLSTGATASNVQLKAVHQSGAVNYVQVQGGSTTNYARVEGAGTDANVSVLFSSKGNGNTDLWTQNGGVLGLRVSHTASGVNYLNVAAAATGNGVTLSALGSDATVAMVYQSKSTAPHWFLTNNNTQFRVTDTPSAVNYLNATGNSTGAGPTLSAQGSDTNIDINVTPKGTGNVVVSTNLRLPGGNAVYWGGTANYISGSSASNFIVLATNSIERLRIDASGSLGIGVSPPTWGADWIGTNTRNLSIGSVGANFSGGQAASAMSNNAHYNGTNWIYSTAGNATYYIQKRADGSHQWFTAASGSAGGTVAFTQSMTLNAFGRLLLGSATDNGNDLAQINGRTMIGTNANGGAGLLIYSAAAATHYNWKISTQDTVSGAFELARSTVVGGNTYASPYLVMTSAGRLLLNSSTDDGNNTLQVTGSATISSTLATGGNITATATTGTNAISTSLVNTGGTYFFGINNSTGTAFGGSAYALTLYAPVGRVIESIINGGVITSVSSAGFSVGGTLSATGRISTTQSGQAILASGATTSQRYLEISNTGAVVYLGMESSAGGNLVTGSGSYAATLATNSGQMNFGVNSARALVLTNPASAVNYIALNGAAASSSPYLWAQGSDTNINFDLFSKGTGAIRLYTNSTNEQARIAHTGSAVNYTLITGGAAGSHPYLWAQGSDTNINFGVYSKGTGVIRLFTNSGDEQVRINHSAAAVNRVNLTGGATAVNTTLGVAAEGSDTNIYFNYYSKGDAGHRFWNGGLEQVRITYTASAVNYVLMTGSATGSGVSIKSAGSDTNIALRLSSKGTGNVTVYTNDFGQIGFNVVNVASSVNYLQATPALVGGPVVLSAQGDGTDIGVVINPKGTGFLSAQVPDSTTAGGNARGNRAVDWSTARGSAANVASGQSSVIGGGVSNTASGLDATVPGGINNTASGSYSFAAGISSTASGIAAVAMGDNCLANSQSGVALGRYSSTRGVIGAFAFAGDGANSSAVSQAQRFVMRSSTSDATPTVVTTSYGSAAGTGNQVILPNNSAYYATVKVLARSTAGNVWSGTGRALVKRGANAAATSIVGSSAIAVDFADGGFSVSVSMSADTTNGGLAFTATGVAATSISWTIEVETIEVL